MEAQVLTADLQDSRHREAIVQLLESYASDPVTGSGEPLSELARAEVAGGLQNHPTALALLAEIEGELVGLAVCFEGFSTFAAKPLLNLHDLVVHPDWRGRGVGTRLLEAVEQHARQRGCCSMTLEVNGDNTGAQRLYRSYGFVGGETISPAGAMMFWKKRLE